MPTSASGPCAWARSTISGSQRPQKALVPPLPFGTPCCRRLKLSFPTGARQERGEVDHPFLSLAGGARERARNPKEDRGGVVRQGPLHPQRAASPCAGAS